MAQNLADIRYNIEKANRTDGKVQNLASYIDFDLLKSIHKRMDKNKASGVDKVTKAEYEAELDDNLEKLVARMKDGTYRPNPTRRVYIPKDGSTKMRPLGISCYEDKLVENAVAQILTMVYEPKFYPCSFGFRPGRNCHMAVREIIEMVQYRKTNYVVEADMRLFFCSETDARRSFSRCKTGGPDNVDPLPCGLDLLGDRRRILTQAGGNHFEGKPLIKRILDVDPIPECKVFLVSWYQSTHVSSFYCCQKEISRYHTRNSRVNHRWSMAVDLWITGMKPVIHTPTASAETAGAFACDRVVIIRI